MSFSRSLLLVIWSLLGFLTLASVSFAQDNQVKTYATHDGLAGDYVTAIAFARDGSAWIATTEGATHIEPEGWTSYTRVHGLGDSWITAIAVAPDDRVWFATQSGGVSVLDPVSKKITTYTLDNSEIPSNFITQLVVDSNNRVWIDTLNKGVAQFDTTTQKWESITAQFPAQQSAPETWRATQRGLVVTNPPAWLNPPKPYPTVLIHGWTVSGDDTLETSEFHFLKSYADRDGIPMYYVRGVSPKNTLYQNAEIIRDEIARVKQETGADKVNLIGFSMGGMNTRAYLETSLYANDVNRAIILGTPQAGVEVWKPMLFQQILQKPDEPSTIELSPEYAQQVVNATRSPNPNVPYDLLIGDASRQEYLGFFEDMPKSDALISVASSLALDGANVRKHVNADLHDWNPQAVPLDFTSYLYPRDTWERYLRNALRNHDNAPIGSEIATDAPAPNLETPQSNHTPVVTEKIRAGETMTRTVLIDENKSARFVAYYPGGKIDFSLVAPDGTVYKTEELPRDEDKNVFSLTTDAASFSGHLVKNALVGKWQMILKRTDAGSQPIDVSTYVELDAPRRVEFFMRFGTVIPGIPNQFSAQVRGTTPDTISIPTHLNVTIANPPEQLGKPYSFTKLELLDDGQHDDGSAHDGYFANTFTATRAGWYPVFITAQGNDFEREAEFLYQVPPDTAAFQSGLSLKIENDATMPNQNILSSIGVEVKRAGSYALAAEIRNDQDAVAARSFTPITLNPGAQRIPFSLLVSDPNARYTLHLTLYDTNWAALPIASMQADVKFQQP